MDVANTVLPMILPRIERIRWTEARLGHLVTLLDQYHRADLAPAQSRAEPTADGIVESGEHQTGSS